MGQEYEFDLTFSLPDALENPEIYVEALGERCDDALIGIGQKGRISLSFIRQSDTDLNAVTSAIADVMRAIPGAKLIEMIPGLNVTMRIIPDVVIPGSSLDEFLSEEGILEEAEGAAKAKVVEWKASHSFKFNHTIFDLYYNGRGCEFWEAWILATQPQ